MGSQQTPLVSVCIATFNHKKYIQKTIESVISQKSNFKFNIIIGEDGSTDGTGEICLHYSKLHPELIQLYRRNRKDVIYVNGLPTGKFNTKENFKAAEGKYIALLDGDDYWTDPYKLQKQVDFLEANHDYALSFHNINTFKQDTSEFIPFKKYSQNTFFIDDVINKNIHIHVCSMVFRNKIGVLPDWFFKSISGDFALNIILGAMGKIHYINEPMAVYRIHDKGVFSNVIIKEKKKKLNNLYLNNINTLYRANKYYNYLYQESFKTAILNRFKIVSKNNATFHLHNYFLFILSRIRYFDNHLMFHFNLIKSFIKHLLKNKIL